MAELFTVAGREKWWSLDLELVVGMVLRVQRTPGNVAILVVEVVAVVVVVVIVVVRKIGCCVRVFFCCVDGFFGRRKCEEFFIPKDRITTKIEGNR